MIIFILVHLNLRKTIDIVNSIINNSKVKIIYIIYTFQTKIYDKKLVKIKLKHPNKLIFYKHYKKGIKGAWVQSMEIAIQQKSNFLIFENDIVPTNFFINFAELSFSFYKNDKNFFGFTGSAPHERSIIKNTKYLDTILSYRSNSWSFGSYPIIAQKFLNFLLNNSKDQIGKILFDNRKIIGNDIYNHYLIDKKNPNKYLWAYMWNAFVLENNGYFLHPSEHLVSFYGYDDFAENGYDYGLELISESDIKFSKKTKINFMTHDEFSFKKNSIVVNHSNPNIFRKLFKKVVRKLKYFYKKIYE